MARDRANIFTDIWTDDDWRNLARNEQVLYLTLLTHPELSYAGVADWRPGRLAQMSADASRAEVEDIGASLQAKRFILIDSDTEEVLVRSFIKHDGVLKHPKLCISFVNAYAAVASRAIRMVITHELKRLHARHPDWKAFEFERVVNLLAQPSIDMANLTLGFTPPPTVDAEATQPLAQPLAQGLPQPLPTATATATATPPEGGGSGGRRLPERPLPAEWSPNDAHRGYADEHGINLDFQAERFKSWALAKDTRYRNWDQGFRNWLLKAEKSTTASKNPLWDA